MFLAWLKSVCLNCESSLMAGLYNTFFSPRRNTPVESLCFVLAGRPEVTQVPQMPEIPNVLHITV